MRHLIDPGSFLPDLCFFEKMYNMYRVCLPVLLVSKTGYLNPVLFPSGVHHCFQCPFPLPGSFHELIQRAALNHDGVPCPQGCKRRIALIHVPIYCLPGNSQQISSLLNAQQFRCLVSCHAVLSCSLHPFSHVFIRCARVWTQGRDLNQRGPPPFSGTLTAVYRTCLPYKLSARHSHQTQSRVFP